MSSKLSSKALTTAALLGEPTNSGASSSATQPKRKKVKKEEGAGGGVGLSSHIPLDKQIVKLLSTSPQGLAQDFVCTTLQCKPSDIIDSINELLNRHRIEVLQDASQKIHYKLVSAEKVEKLQGLSPSQVTVYQHIEKSSSTGKTKIEIRRLTNLSVIELDSIIKFLTQKKLIKEIKTVDGGNRKRFMLYDIEPAKEISGGVWYDKSTGEFDNDLLQNFEKVITEGFLKKKLEKWEYEQERIARGTLDPDAATEKDEGHASPSEIEHFLSSSGIFSVVPNEEETTKILNGLVYEGILEKTVDEMGEWMKHEKGSSHIKQSSSAAAASSSLVDPSKKRKARDDSMVYKYRYVKSGAFQSTFQSIPCATCPVAASCHEGNPISPQSCEYLKKWLEF